MGPLLQRMGRNEEEHDQILSWGAHLRSAGFQKSIAPHANRISGGRYDEANEVGDQTVYSRRFLPGIIDSDCSNVDTDEPTRRTWHTDLFQPRLSISRVLA